MIKTTDGLMAMSDRKNYRRQGLRERRRWRSKFANDFDAVTTREKDGK